MGKFKPRASAEPMASLRVQFMTHDTTLSNATLPPDILGEHLYFSACLDEGHWNPRKDGLAFDDFTVTPEMFVFCQVHAKHSGGQMPPLPLLKSTFPDLVYVHGINKSYAAHRVLHTTGIKNMYKEMRHASDMLKRGDLDEAVEYLATAARKAKRVKAGTSLQSIDTDDSAERLSSLYPGMEQAGGLRTGYYVIVGGRPGDGKSWRLMQHAVDLAGSGRNVTYFSLEMNQTVCANRFHQIMFGREADNMNWHDRADAVGRWLDERGGSISIKDPGHGQAVTPLSVSRSCEHGDIAIIDYLGLMTSGGGSRSIEDWRAAALISNELRIVSLADGITVIAGAQLNRGTGDNPRSNPTLALISQSDAIGQDADIAVVLRKPSAGVTSNFVVKSRHGATGGKWFTRFDPMAGDFSQVSMDEALDIINSDKDVDEE